MPRISISRYARDTVFGLIARSTATPANRRQLIAGTQVAGGHRGENLVDELPINRDTAVGIEVESEDGEMGIECHVEQCTS